MLLPFTTNYRPAAPEYGFKIDTAVNTGLARRERKAAHAALARVAYE
jgi:hypothetical protein